MQMSPPSSYWTLISAFACSDFLLGFLLGNTSKRLNAYNGLTNRLQCSHAYFKEINLFQAQKDTWSVKCPSVHLTKHSKSLAGREMMMRSFFASSVTKATSELSERSKAWHEERFTWMCTSFILNFTVLIQLKHADAAWAGKCGWCISI